MKPCAPKSTTVAALLSKEEVRVLSPQHLAVINAPKEKSSHFVKALAACPSGQFPRQLLRPPAW